MKTIELDCAPESPRPDTYIAAVVADTYAQLVLAHPVSKLFGCWTWAFDVLTDDEWIEVQKVTRPRIEALYNAGLIRYGSW